MKKQFSMNDMSSICRRMETSEGINWDLDTDV